MSYPTKLKIWIDGIDSTYYIFGSNTFDPDSTHNTFRDLDITPYLRKITTPGKMMDRNNKSDGSVSQLHTIEITAGDGNGRVECRVSIR